MVFEGYVWIGRPARFFAQVDSNDRLAFSFIARPHPQDADRFLSCKDFVHDAVLNIDATRVCAGKIADQFFKGRWILQRVVGKDREQFLRFWF